MAYGLTPEGFVIKPTEIIKGGMEDATRLVFGASIPLGERTFFGHVIGLQAAAVGEIWEVAQEIVASDDPDAATGDRLKALSALTGTTPLPSKKSEVVITLTGDPLTVVDALSRVKTESTNKEFITVESTTITLVPTITTPTAYLVGDRVTLAGRVYQCITAGTTGVLFLGVGDDEVSNTAHFRYIGDGTAAIDVTAFAAEAGEIIAVDGDILDIVTPVSGWLSVKNLEDAIVGRDAETDPTLRARREAELSTGGSTPVDALRADLLQVLNVSSVTVFSNSTDVTDGDGMPPHSVEALIRGGDPQEIYDQLLASVAAGIQTFGTETGAALDSEGNSYVMRFSRPDEIEIWLELTLTYDADLYPDDGDDQVIQAIVDYGNEFETGHDAYPSSLSSRAFQVAGVLNVSAVLIGVVDPPVGTTPIAIALRELAVYSVLRVVVNSSAATP